MKRLLVSLIGVSALVVAGALWAQTGQQADYYVTGTVVSSSPDHLVVSTQSGGQMDFTVDSQTVLPSNLSSGTTVDVKYQDTASGGYQAAEVRAVGTTSSASEPAQTPPSGSGSESMPAQSGTHDTMQDENLPQTADPVVLVGLLGLASLGAGAGLRRFYR